MMLRQRLDHLQARLRDLHQVMTREGEALRQGRTDALPELSAAKERSAHAVTEGWVSLTAALGLPSSASRAEIERHLTGHGDPGLMAAWMDTMALAEETGRMNRLNGRLIQESLARTRRALEVLQSAAQQQGLYGADGLGVEIFSHSRTIDEV